MHYAIGGGGVEVGGRVKVGVKVGAAVGTAVGDREEGGGLVVRGGAGVDGGASSTQVTERVIHGAGLST